MRTVTTKPTTIVSAPHRSHTFQTLDALRGIAAVIVIVLHSRTNLGHLLFVHGYMAVDFFFMLSGFVLSYAYQQQLDQGLSTLRFLKLRIFRLYPLYLVGTAMGFVYSLVAVLHTGSRNLYENFFLLLTALFFIPTPMPANYPGVAAFPYDSFAWSLFYELLANIVHATLLRRRSTRILLLCTGVAGILLFSMVARDGSVAYGTLTRDLPFGTVRVLFSYLVGLLLFRFWSRHRDKRHISPVWSVLLLGTSLAVPNITHGNALYEIPVLLLVLPTVVLLGAFSQPSGLVRPIASALGLLSYGIYILSSGLMLYIARAWAYLFKSSPATAAPWSGIIFIILIFEIAYIANFAYDVPVRRWLRTRFGN